MSFTLDPEVAEALAPFAAAAADSTPRRSGTSPPAAPRWRASSNLQTGVDLPNVVRFY